MKSPNALVLQAPGINCDEETAFALDQAGANVEKVHIRQLNNGERSWDNYQILAFPGGFSYGDDIASGRLLGTEIRKKHAEELDKYAKSGKAIIGICNGFQVLVETGLLPSGEVRVDTPKNATLTHNQMGRFESRWVDMHVNRLANSYFVNQETLGEYIELPVAHGEGRLVFAPNSKTEPEDICLQFADENGSITEDYPANPNGSSEGITAISANGNILGMMPHPERFVSRYQHYNWRRGQGNIPYGAIIFKNIVKYAKES
jgi:phosphoribosylformylglycinamidine synthase subunit PurQ / glutaminase